MIQRCIVSRGPECARAGRRVGPLSSTLLVSQVSRGLYPGAKSLGLGRVQGPVDFRVPRFRASLPPVAEGSGREARRRRRRTNRPCHGRCRWWRNGGACRLARSPPAAVARRRAWLCGSAPCQLPCMVAPQPAAWRLASIHRRRQTRMSASSVACSGLAGRRIRVTGSPRQAPSGGPVLRCRCRTDRNDRVHEEIDCPRLPGRDASVGLDADVEALRPASSLVTRARISASDWPAMRAALRALTSSDGQPTARGPSLTGRVQRPWLIRRYSVERG